MKQQILDALRTRFAGVSEAILGRIADKLAKTITEADGVKDAVEAVTSRQVLESYGDSRATEAQQTAVRNYEAKHGLHDGKPVKPEGSAPEAAQAETAAVPEWAKALVRANADLKAQLTALQTERLADTRRQRLASLTEKLPEAMRRVYNRIPLDGMTDEEFDVLTGEVGKDAEAFADESRTRGAVFGRPTAHTAQPADGELTKSQQEAIAHREGTTAGEGQPF